jgi:hypothetical protein
MKMVITMPCYFCGKVIVNPTILQSNCRAEICKKADRRIRHRAYRQRDEYKAYHNEWALTNIEKVRDYKRKWKLKYQARKKAAKLFISLAVQLQQMIVLHRAGVNVRPFLKQGVICHTTCPPC